MFTAIAIGFGAAWKAKSVKGSDYLSVKLDVRLPCFDRLVASLVEMEGEEWVRI